VSIIEKAASRIDRQRSATATTATATSNYKVINNSI